MILLARVGRRRHALALMLALLLSACSGDGGGGGGGRGEAGQANANSSTEEADGYRAAEQALEPEAQERAQSVPLTLSDLPDSWQPHEGGVGVIGACLGGDLSALTIVGAAQGKDFQHSGTGRVTSAAQVFATEQMAAEELEILATEVEREEVERCVADLLGRHPDAPEIGADIREISIPPPSGVDETRAWQVAITYHEEGAPFTAYDQMFVLREEDTTAFVMTWSFLTPFNPVLRDEMIAMVASRIVN